MRIAVLIIGLLPGLLLVIQSIVIGMFSESTIVDDTTSSAGAAGLLMALMWLVACALVIPFPQVSFPIFLLTAVIGLATPAGKFSDIRFHGAAAILLAGMAFLGWLGKRKERRTFLIEKARQEERDIRLETLLRQQARSAQLAVQVRCPSCERMNSAGARFCGKCGAALVANA